MKYIFIFIILLTNILFAKNEYLIKNDNCKLELINDSLSTQGFCSSVHNILKNFKNTEDLTFDIEPFPFFETTNNPKKLKELTVDLKYYEKKKKYFFRVKNENLNLNMIPIDKKVKVGNKLFMFEEYSINNLDKKSYSKKYMVKLSVYDKKKWMKKNKKIKFILKNYYKLNQAFSLD